MVVAWGIVVVFGLSDVLVAVLGLAVVVAAVPLGVLAGNAARALPWPLYLAADLAVKAVQLAVQSTISWTEASANGLANAIQAPWQAVWTVAQATTGALESLYWSVWRVYYLALPAVYSWAYGAISAAELAAVQHADQLAGLLAAYTRSLVGAAMQRADQEFSQVAQQLEATALAEGEYARALAGTTIARADAEFGQAVAHADQVGQALTAYALSLATDGIAYTQRVEAQLELELERVGRADVEYTRTVAGELVREIARAQAQAVATAGAATAVVATAVQAIEDSPCQRFCSPLGDLGQLLQDLEDAGLMALLLGLLAEVRQDPGAVQDVLRRDVVPIARGALGAVRAGA